MGVQVDHRRLKWKKRIDLWRYAGKSAADWCREHKLAYRTFLYWKTRLAEENCGKFIEVEDDQPRYTGVTIETDGLTIQLARDFDTSALQRLLKVVRRG